MNIYLISTFLDIFKEYIAPLLIVLALAALFSFALSFLGQKLKVEHDERIDRIQENLSGLNCGGCGYAGCSAFAEALLKGETSLDSCAPTRGEKKQKIAEILGVSVQDTEVMTAVVHCNGGTECADKGGYRGYGDCESCNMLSGGNKACDVACMGLGSCIKACQYNAISLDDKGVARINDNCVFCGACLKKCPKGIIGQMPLDKKIYVACSNLCAGKIARTQCKRACIACGLCVKACKSDAIEIKDNLARINYKKCVECGECVKVCPNKCFLIRSDKA